MEGNDGGECVGVGDGQFHLMWQLAPGQIGNVGAMGYSPVAALGSDLLEFWDAEYASQLTLNGAEVVTWASGKSGLAPTQATAASRPTYNATGLNGRPCTVYDGAAQQLTVSGVGNMPTGANTCEIWLLGSQDALAASSGGRVAFSYGNGGVVGQLRSVGRVSSGANRLNVVMGTGAADIMLTGTVVDMSGTCLIRARMEASQILGTLNGTAEGATAGTLGGTPTTRTRIGAFASSGVIALWLGKISAIYVTNLLTPAQAIPLQAYFLARGGI